MRNGEFTDEEFTAARLSLIGALETAGDSLGGLEGYYFTQIFTGSNRTPAQEIREIEEVTRQDVMEAAKQITLDTVYFLEGEVPSDEQ